MTEASAERPEAAPEAHAGGTFPDAPMLSSMARISDLEAVPYQVRELPRTSWATGDYAVAEVVEVVAPRQLELPTGRMVDLGEGDVFVGALGRRHATLEATGSWEAVGEDGGMELLTQGGLLGKATSWSRVLPPLVRLRYRGHVTRQDAKVTMAQFVAPPEASEPPVLDLPTVMIIGTSMSAGKTATARAVIRRLRRMGSRVVAAKVTGAGRYRDILTMKDSGAETILDFVDVGLPSTVCPEEEYNEALHRLLERMDAAPADAAVVEVGASPLEAYNGTAAVAALAPSVLMTILSASDPYAVVGLIHAYGEAPDLVTGIASNTRAGVELVETLSGVRCLDVRDPDALRQVDRLLQERLWGR